ncbi:hypothetical protein niasHT_013025 [Heterodera trifolii]|uniref:Uncharacterized protein n=1 Tax=Heterodera trifolii TaxID=157864 RepID=A0ABD2L3I9_9BILA
MLKINGTYWMLQQPRVTTASAPMVNAIKRALLAFHCQNRFFPEHIFVFRSVASEGEYKKGQKGTKNKEKIASDQTADPSGGIHSPLQTLIFSATLTFTHHIPLRRGKKETQQTATDPKQKVSECHPIYV